MLEVDEFCTSNFHLEREVFGFSKYKLDLPLDVEEEPHRLDKVSFSHPYVSRRMIRARHICIPIIDKEEGPHLQAVASLERTIQDLIASLPLEGWICHLTAIKKTTIDVKEWGIARLSKLLKKGCWKNRVITKKKFDKKIIEQRKPTPAPTYIGNGSASRRTTIKSPNSSFVLTTLRDVLKVSDGNGLFHILKTKRGQAF